MAGSSLTKTPKQEQRQSKQDAVKVAKQGGMGAIVTTEGVAFRVWAPHASQVFVTGTFNGWAPATHVLTSEENGYWSGLVNTAKVGDEYRFLIHDGQENFSRIDPYAREVTSSVGNAIVVDPAFDWGNEPFELPDWNELVIYELHIGTFHDKAKDAPGTFYSAIEKLPHLKALGINAIEVMPSTEFPGSLSWGYNPAHPFALERDYGGVQGFRAFVKACHEQGIGVIVDVVYNHFGPSDLDLWRFDGWSENEGGGIYFYNDWRATTPWGATRPDYGRPEVRHYIRDNALMWLQDYHVDGLRWDATAYIRNVNGNSNSADDLPDGWSLMQWVNEEVHALYPNALTIAEDLRVNEWVTKTTGAGGSGFGAQWDAEFVHPLRAVILAVNDADRDLGKVRNAILHRYAGDVFFRIIYTESHDEVANGKARIPEEISPGQPDTYFAKKRSTLGAAVLLTAPGIPMLFQGQEFLEDRWFADTDPLEWSLLEKHPGIVDLYRHLIHLRRNFYGNTAGLCGQEAAVTHLNNEQKLLVWQRWQQDNDQQRVVVVANFANQAQQEYRIGLPNPGQWLVRFNSDWNGYDAEFSNVTPSSFSAEVAPLDDQPCSAVIAIGPYSLLILSQEGTL
jgi:1,4-alpha-glucan branching enzyme